MDSRDASDFLAERDAVTLWTAPRFHSNSKERANASHGLQKAVPLREDNDIRRAESGLEM